jgi:hypothetical protein
MYGKIAAIGLGAGLMYLLDPEKGKQRREQISDLACQATRITKEATEKTVHDARKQLLEARDRVESWGSSVGIIPQRKKSFFSFNGTTSRFLTGAAGAGLTFYGLRRWGKTGMGLATVGLSLLATGISGRNFIG